MGSKANVFSSAPDVHCIINW